MAAQRRSNQSPRAVPPGTPLSRARAEFYLANYPVDKAELYFALRIPDGIPDIEDEIHTATELRQRLQIEPAKPGPVFDALRALGLSALWITDEWETNPEALDSNGLCALRDLREDIRGRVRKHVGKWFNSSRTSLAPSQRRNAAEQLRQLGAFLAGDRRGKHGVIVSPFMVKRLYAEQLFRFFRFVRELKSIERRRITQADVFGIRDMCKVAPEIVGDNFHFDGNLLRSTRPVQTERSAVRSYIAAKYKLELSTVSTILSRAGMKTLRK